jgi:hypothetical protein
MTQIEEKPSPGPSAGPSGPPEAGQAPGPDSLPASSSSSNPTQGPPSPNISVPTEHHEAAERLRQALDDMKSSNPAIKARAEAEMPELLRTMASTSVDPKEKQSWYERANAWASEGADHEVILKSIGLGLAAIIAAPFAIAGAAVAGAGAIVFGVGKVVQGIGHLLFTPAKGFF